MKTKTSPYRAAATLLLLAACLSPAAADAADGGDAARGQSLYESRCIGCHSLDSNRVGPKHRGVFGRQVGGVVDFAYSDALAGAALVWDERNLDRWLADPQGFLPGQRMNIKVKEARDRADLIAFLRRESTGAGQ